MPQVPATPFVGRIDELAKLHQILDSIVSANQPKFVFIQGDYGMGKTTLAERFLDEVALKDPLCLLGRGRCAMETELNGLVPFGQLLSDLSEQGHQKRVIGGIAKFLGSIAPAWLDVFTGGIWSASVKTAQEGVKFFAPNTFSQQNVFVQYVNVLDRLANKQPIITFIDDLQWADESSLRLLFHLMCNLQGRAVMFILAYRPVEAMETGRNAALFREIYANLVRYGAIELRLDDGIDIVRYVAQRYNPNKFSPDVLNRIEQQTKGHPLLVRLLFDFWEETAVVTSTFANDGTLVWDFAREPNLNPEPINEAIGKVLEARIQIMERDLREMLTCASVEGEDFTTQIVARVRQLDEDEISQSLDSLERGYRLIKNRGARRVDATVLDFYRFAHRFIREHIYSQLNSYRRSNLHRQVGECLESLCSDRSEVAAQLALHFREAREILKSAKYALMAARFEQSRYAWKESAQWCQFGLDIMSELPLNAESSELKLDLLRASGFGDLASGNYASASRKYQEALILALELPATPESIVSIYESLVTINELMGKYQEAMNFLDRGRQILAKHTVSFGELHVSLLVHEGILSIRLGSTNSAIQFLREALAHLEQLPVTPTIKRIETLAYNYLGVALGQQGHFTDCFTCYSLAIEGAKRIGDRRLEGLYTLNMADDSEASGALEQSLRYANEGLAIAQQVGELDDVAYAQVIRGTVFLAMGKTQEAKKALSQAIALSESLGSGWNIQYMYACLARVHLAQSEPDAAYQHAIQSIALTSRSQFDSGFALDTLAQIEVVRQDLQSAEQHFRQAIAVHQQAGHRLWEARVQRHLAGCLQQQGKHPEATQLLQTAVAVLRELKLDQEAIEIQQQLDTIITI